VIWHLLVTPPWSGAANMAADLALAALARRTKQGYARVYSWRVPTVSFGRHQRAQGVYAPSLIAADGYDVVRRPTGGRALLHARELTYALALPDEGRSIRASHAQLTAHVAAALARLGVATTTAPRAPRWGAPGIAPCFDTPAEGELLADGAKLVGSAQVREDGVVLQHGSVLVDDDQGRLSRYLLVPPRPVPAPQTLRQLLGRAPTAPEFADALADVLREASGAACVRLSPSALDVQVLREQLHRFHDPAWTWGR
jgi:lipoate-protein ligase A